MSEEEYNDDDFISYEEFEALSEDEKAEYEITQLNEITSLLKDKAKLMAKAMALYPDRNKTADDNYAKRMDYLDKMHKDAKDAFNSGDHRKAFKMLKHAKDNLKNIGEEYELDESAASDTLKAGSSSIADPKTKIETITAVIGAMHAMRKDDLTKWYTQAMDLIGKEADSLPSGANADSNSSSIDTKLGKGPKTRDPMPKLSVKEDVEEMFDGQDLSEEFKDRASTLFEAAVNAKIIVELAKLEEQYDERLTEEVAEITEALEAKLDTYLDYVTETWLKENEVAIESTLRNEITEEFIDGLRGLFAEHYIEVPENKIDVIEELAAKVEALETKLDESITENVQLREALTVSEMTDILREMAEDLTLNESEKFAALAEGIEFDGDLDTYRKKLAYVKESYFNKKTVQRVSNIEEETFEAPESDRVVSADPEISRYAQAISRTVKR